MDSCWDCSSACYCRRERDDTMLPGSKEVPKIPSSLQGMKQITLTSELPTLTSPNYLEFSFIFFGNCPHLKPKTAGQPAISLVIRSFSKFIHSYIPLHCCILLLSHT
ncbi:uncharacterized protein [Anser cygnoides]|uniref:uncharacterized protein isoform X4 n=1 Tax=Anser cygnoides TaxID=8845 RepID=UPI0034D2397E